MALQRVGYDLVTEQQTTNNFKKCFEFIHVISVIESAHEEMRMEGILV